MRLYVELVNFWSAVRVETCSETEANENIKTSASAMCGRSMGVDGAAAGDTFRRQLGIG